MESIPKSFSLYKRLGETPLEALKRVREKFPNWSTIKMTYAGRLDPLAEGLLLILTGEECKNKSNYLGWDKEYEVGFLIGVSTDSGDVLGLARIEKPSVPFPETKIIASLQSLLGLYTQTYPRFSSPYLAGQVGKTKEIEIKSIDFIASRYLSDEELLSQIIDRVMLVKGKFRQEEIISRWKEEIKLDQKFLIINCRVVCTSGTYIRVLADRLGQILNSQSCVFSLKRTKIGELSLPREVFGERNLLC